MHSFTLYPHQLNVPSSRADDRGSYFYRLTITHLILPGWPMRQMFQPNVFGFPLHFKSENPPLILVVPSS
uniref:Uncharacterized protein n=1 Tax=Arundo donax TaxID=35708 RepID=A0A0A9EK43_ARUDO